MKIDWLSMLNILGHSPGDLVYHLVVGSALLLILIVAYQRREISHRSSDQKHVLIGASLLLSLHAILFILNQILNLSNLVSPTFAALIESLIQTLSLVWLIWTFIDRDETFLISGAGIFISLAMLLWGAVSLGLLLLNPSFVPTDNAWLFSIWDLGAVALAALGLAVLWRKRPHGWVTGFAILLILGIGHGIQVVFANPNAIRPGTVRLAQALAMPWVIILLQRFRESEDQETSKPDWPQWANIRPALVDELLKISNLANAKEKYQAVARALSLSLVADFCYLLRLDEAENTVALLAGYDLIREQPLPTARLSRDDLPNILNAWENSQPFAPNHPPVETQDAETLMDIFNYQHTGNLLAYPLGVEDQPLKGGVIFLSPYTDKKWGKTSLEFLEDIRSTLAEVLFEPSPSEKLTSELAEVRRQADQLQQKSDSLSQSLSESRATVDHQAEEIGQLKAKYQIEKLQLVKQIDACQEKIIHLSSLAASHKQDLAKLDELKNRIRDLITERDQLERDLAQANTRIESLESQISSASAPQQASQIEVLSMDAIAANVKLAFGPRAQRKEISLDITNPDGHQLIKTNPDLLHTLVNNLVENALLATKPDGALHLRMKLSFETGMLQIQVTDSGEGLSPEEQRSLFSDLEESPSGIGSRKALLEAVRIVQAFNGKIWLRSKEGAYTSFRVQLPVRIMD